jgi:hypothetical protein
VRHAVTKNRVALITTISGLAACSLYALYKLGAGIVAYVDSVSGEED